LAEELVELDPVVADAAHQRHRVVVGWRRKLGEEDVGGLALRLQLVAEGQRPLPCLTPRRHARSAPYARARYSPVRVSTFTASPGSTNSGTCTTSPVSSVAGFRAPETRSPCPPGSV